MIFRKATKQDIPSIVEMIADDELGAKRENFQLPLPAEYLNAFEQINADNNQELIVVENLDSTNEHSSNAHSSSEHSASEHSEIIGTLQLTFIPYLTYRGGIRAQIEAVRIKKSKRGLGIGKQMMEWAINRAKERKAHVLQLTTDKKRPEAIQFYEDLGFILSHEGMKMHFQ